MLSPLCSLGCNLDLCDFNSLHNNYCGGVTFTYSLSSGVWSKDVQKRRQRDQTMCKLSMPYLKPRSVHSYTKVTS